MRRQVSALIAISAVTAAAWGFAAPAAAQFAPAAPSAPKAARVIYTLDQIQAGAIPTEVLQQLGPLHTLAEVEPLLKKNKIPYTRAKNVLDSDAIDPAAAQQIAAVGKNDIFVAPLGTGWIIAAVISRQDASHPPAQGAKARPPSQTAPGKPPQTPK